MTHHASLDSSLLTRPDSRRRLRGLTGWLIWVADPICFQTPALLRLLQIFSHAQIKQSQFNSSHRHRCCASNRSPTLRSAAPSRAPLRYIAPSEVENMHSALSRRCSSCSTSCRTTLATLVAPHKPSPRVPCTASTAPFWPPLPCVPWAIPRSSRFWTRSRTTGMHWQFSSRGTESALAVSPSQTFRA